ncbi:hypothetical protein BJY01DRAFT_214476 [Aspergillus pseudoustus]|uniref:Uncharacterized protein n=1 Tax=Aspergillus pseudoustus TaxID=1810923 RepID=A0ABR4JYA5_9EURO
MSLIEQGTTGRAAEICCCTPDEFRRACSTSLDIAYISLSSSSCINCVTTSIACRWCRSCSLNSADCFSTCCDRRTFCTGVHCLPLYWSQKRSHLFSVSTKSAPISCSRPS